MSKNLVNSGKTSTDKCSFGETILSEATVLHFVERAETIPQGSRGQAASKSEGSRCRRCRSTERRIQGKGLCIRCYHRQWRKTEDRRRWNSTQYPDGCTKCGRKDLKHQGKGLCGKCYSRQFKRKHRKSTLLAAKRYYQDNRDQRRTYQREWYWSQDEDARRKHAEKAFNRKYDCNGVLALERAGYRCETCGYDRIRGVLRIHHRDKNRKNNELSNLRVLCPTCHEEWHYLDRDIVRSAGRPAENTRKAACS